MTVSAGSVEVGVKPNAKGFGAELSGLLKGESGTMAGLGQHLGGVLAAGIGAALLGTAVVSVKLAEAMQASDAKIQGNAQITAKAAAGIGDAFLHTAGQSTFSGKEMADSFAPVDGVVQTLAGHTLTAADSMKVMSAATTLAEASGNPLAATTGDLVAVMQAYHLKLSDAAGASNVLFNTSRLTNVNLDTLATTVDKLHAKLGIASPSLADTSALMVDLANHGVSGSRGLMVVNTAMGTLLGGSKPTSAEIKTLGLHVFDASGKFVGMRDVLAQLGPKLAGMTQQQRLAAEQTLVGKTAALALNTTIAAGAGGFDKATAAVTKHGAAEYAAKAASSTLEGQQKMLGAAYTDILTLLGEKLIPIITTVITWMDKHRGVTAILAGVIGGILVTALLAWTVQQVALNIALIANPIGLVVIGIAALVAGIIWVATQTTWFQTAWKAMTSALGVAWTWLWNTILQPVIQLILGGFAAVARAIGTVLSALGNVPGFGWAKTAGDAMLGAANGADSLAKSITKIPATVPVDVSFTSNYSVIGEQVASLQSGKNKRAAIGNNAAGTDNWRGGPTWVGENGPEILDLDKGSTITPNSALGGGGGTQISVGTVQAHDYNDFIAQMSAKARTAALVAH